MENKDNQEMEEEGTRVIGGQKVASAIYQEVKQLI
jgi:hypothetical protein